MATIDIYIRTQSKTKSLVKMRFRLRDKSVILNYTSEIEIPPKIWEAKKQNIKDSNQLDFEDEIRIEKLISDRKTLILSIFSTSHKDEIDSEWLCGEIEKALNSTKSVQPKIYNKHIIN
jgi:hypothetical protein